MTNKMVKCADCKFCDERCWCRLKALQISPQSVRTCKVYAKRQAAS